MKKLICKLFGHKWQREIFTPEEEGISWELPTRCIRCGLGSGIRFFVLKTRYHGYEGDDNPLLKYFKSDDKGG